MPHFKKRSRRGGKEIQMFVKDPAELTRALQEVDALEAAHELGELPSDGEVRYTPAEMDHLIARHNSGDGGSETSGVASTAFRRGWERVFGN